MKHDWEYKKLGDIISPAKSERYGDRDSLPILSITMREGIVHQTERFKKVIASRETSGYKVIKRGQLVIAFPIDEGLIYIQNVADEGIMSPAYNVWDVNYNLLNGRFLEMYLHSKEMFHYYKEKLRGTTQRRRMLPKEDLLAIPIPVPALAVQERIVGELDKVSEIIEKKKQQVKELDSLAQSIFYDMFGDPVENEKGWEKQMIGELCEDKKSIIRANKTFCQTDIIRYIDISSIDNKANVVVSMTQFVYKDAPSRAQQVVNYGDILVSLVRPNLKNIATVNDLGEDLVASSGFCVLRTKMCAQLFLKGVLLSDRFTKYLTDRVSGANYPAIREEDIKCCSISVPPLSLQQAFAEKVEAIEKQKELITASLKEAERLFDARMEYWFGE